MWNSQKDMDELIYKERQSYKCVEIKLYGYEG